MIIHYYKSSLVPQLQWWHNAQVKISRGYAALPQEFKLKTTMAQVVVARLLPREIMIVA